MLNEKEKAIILDELINNGLVSKDALIKIYLDKYIEAKNDSKYYSQMIDYYLNACSKLHNELVNVTGKTYDEISKEFYGEKKVYLPN